MVRLDNVPRTHSSTINSLFYKCLKVNLNGNNHDILPIHIRQEMVIFIASQQIIVELPFLIDLIKDGIYTLDLWSISSNNNFSGAQMSQIFNTLSSNSQMIRDLTLGGSNWIYDTSCIKGSFRKFLQTNLCNLECLKLQQTSSVDEILSIFQRCPNLVQFEISQPSLNCKDISIIERELEKPIYSQVKLSLREFKLPSTCKSGGLMKILSLFPHLKRLKCCHFEPLLDSLEKERKVSIRFQIIEVLKSLKGLTVTHPMSEDSVLRLVHMCPQLEMLTLEAQGVMNLSPIVDLNHLRCLEIHNSQALPASFTDQVLSVIQKIGTNLESLSLTHFDVIDLSACVRYCPNLKFFSAQWFSLLSCNRTSSLNLSKEERIAIKSPFAQLLYLKLRPSSKTFFTTDIVEFLISSAKNLQHLEIYCCYNLNDINMSKILKLNQLRQLKHLIIRHGHSLTKSFLDRLINSLGNLTYVDFGSPLLSKEEANDENHNIL